MTPNSVLTFQRRPLAGALQMNWSLNKQKQLKELSYFFHLLAKLQMQVEDRYNAEQASKTIFTEHHSALVYEFQN